MTCDALVLFCLFSTERGVDVLYFAVPATAGRRVLLNGRQFAPTTDEFAGTDDLDAHVKKEFGTESRLADWNDLRDAEGKIHRVDPNFVS